jgi:hypothetical protein
MNEVSSLTTASQNATHQAKPVMIAIGSILSDHRDGCMGNRAVSDPRSADNPSEG